MKEQLKLLHPFSRYGLAVALFNSRTNVEDLNLESVAKILGEEIENCLSRFRMKTDSIPKNDLIQHYDPISLKDLKENPSLATGGASEGRYLYPTIITGDKLAGNTFKKSIVILDALGKKSLTGERTLERSFAPITAKVISPIHSAKEDGDLLSLKEPKASRFEAACCAISTLTPLKPASQVKDLPNSKRGEEKFYNTAIIPDLSLAELREFLEVFNRLQISENPETLMQATTPKDKKYKRPKIHSGNYPFAPRNTVFGAVGLLAAIGKWAQRADQGGQEKAHRILKAIAGTDTEQGRPMYLISYEKNAHVSFTHHVVNLSMSGKLYEMIEALIQGTKLYADTDALYPKRSKNLADKEDFESAYNLLDLSANRFLQLFNQPAFQDFLAIRAEYSPLVEPLFKEYFMEARKIDREIVESARALGQWLNRTAYNVARSEVEPGTPDADKKIRQGKAKILVEFESAAMSATSPQDMLYRISTRAGRLLQHDMPASATRYMDETMTGEKVAPKDALHLLIAYMRLRATFEKDESTQPSVDKPNVSPDMQAVQDLTSLEAE
jgi:hypothetical protein